MTDIRCPQCGYAFFDRYGRPEFDGEYEDYWCRGCGTGIVIPTVPDPDLTSAPDEAIVITCTQCDCDHLPFIWEGESMDGDAEHAFECEQCDIVPYHVRVCDPKTATSPEYTTSNPFSGFDTTAHAFRAAAQADHVDNEQTELVQWDDTDLASKTDE